MSEWKWNFKLCLKVLEFLDEVSCLHEAYCPLLFSRYVWLKVWEWPVVSVWNSASSTKIGLEVDLSLKVPGGGVLPAEAVAWWKLLIGKPSWVSLWALFVDSSPMTRNQFYCRLAIKGRWSDADSGLCFALFVLLNDNSQRASFTQGDSLRYLLPLPCPLWGWNSATEVEDFAVYCKASREPWWRLTNTEWMPSAICGSLPRK